VVGLLIGLVLWLAALLLSSFPIPLAAAIVLALWVSSTGALHLDGLADTVDGWVGGRGNRERTLAIMKDPYSGPVAVAALVCLLLLKFGALSALRGSGDLSEMQSACSYILPPTLARATVPLLFAHAAYVRVHGLGADLANYQWRAAGQVVAAVTGLAAIVFGRWYGLVATAVAVVTYLLMRRAFIQRLGGMTGDCAGAMVEVIEVLSLIALVLTASA
jgi:adenosylcobinamide-GDP ribazoletransferase